MASSQVRRSPTELESSPAFTVGQTVEVKAQASEDHPCGWFKGVIKSIKNNVGGFAIGSASRLLTVSLQCALIHFVGIEDSSDDIFELSQIRPESTEKSIDLTFIKRVDLTLAPALKKSPSLPQPGMLIALSLLYSLTG